MAFIVVDLQKKKIGGGYLKIDGKNETRLTDDLIIEVEPGTHHLLFSNQSDLREAGKSLLNLFTDGTVGNSVAERYEITETFSERTIMRLNIVTGPLGQILSAPSYNKAEADDETLQTIAAEYSARQNPSGEYAQEQAEQASNWFKKSILFSLLSFPTIVVPGVLGLVSWWKEMQFFKQYGYRPKRSKLASLASFAGIAAGIVFWVLISKLLKK